MLQIENISDLATAKQVATLLQAENARLLQRLTALTRELCEARGEDQNKQLELELTRLKQHSNALTHRLFGASSEKLPPSEPDETINKVAAKPRRGHGPKAQPKLKQEEMWHDLSDDERECDVCGRTLNEWPGQEEEHEEITVVQRQFVLVTHKLKKYRCRCNQRVLTALAPKRWLPGGRYSLEFAVEVAVAKYLDHQPLDRQARTMQREGLQVTSQTLYDQIERLAEHVEPSYDGVGAYLLGRPYLHLDETTWRMLNRKPSKRWQLWAAASPRAIYYWIHESRSRQAAWEFLQGYQGDIVTDGYTVYKSLVRDHPALRAVYCWAHGRRKFVQARRYYPKECEVVLKLIQKMYRLEGAVPEPRLQSGAERERALQLRALLRDKETRGIVGEIRKWLEEQRALPKDPLGKAVKYMLDHWDGLVRFVDDPLLPIDNNPVERGLRAPVVGRKNHYGSRSQRGTEVAAIFYTLLQTAVLAGEDPRDYLLRAARAAVDEPGAVTLPRGFLDGFG